MALSVTLICNQALAKVGSKRINNYETDTTNEAIQCRTHYESTRDALLRSHCWSFAIGRAELSEDTTAPSFEWDNQFILPTDFLRLLSIDEFKDEDTSAINARFSIEGKRLMTDEDTASIVYIRQVTDVAEFDPLFVECLVLSLALKLVNGLAGTQTGQLKKDIKEELYSALSRARVVNRQEANAGGRYDFRLARYSE
jgi:hypothetical protein